MKKFSSVLIIAVIIMVFSAVLTFAQSSGKAIVDDACSKCHNIKKVSIASKNAAEWEITLDVMIKKGAKIKPEERDPVLKYLNALNK